jgi:hypothetical protein
VKVEDQATTFLGQSHVREELGLADRSDRDHTLHFDNDGVLNDEIDAIIADGPTFVQRRDANLILILERAGIELDAQSPLVNGFEQAWAEISVYLDCGADDPSRQRIVSLDLCASVSLWFDHGFILR